MLIIGNAGLNIPAVVVSANWTAVMTTAAVSTITQQTLDDLATDICAHGVYGFEPLTVTRGGISIHLTEPPSAETRFLVAAGPHNLADRVCTIARQPKFVTSRAITVKTLEGTFIEFKFAAYLQAAVRYKLISALALGRPGLTQAKNAAERQLLSLQFEPSDALTPIAVLVADGLTVKTTTNAQSWPDPATRVTIAVEPVATAMADIFKAPFPAESHSAVVAAVLPKLRASLEGFSAAVDIGAVCGRTLSPTENAALEASVGSAFALPLLILNTVGEHSKVFSIAAFYDAVLAVSKRVASFEDAVIDIDSTPRTVAEYISSVVGAVDERFLASVDLFYRNRLEPVSTPVMPMGVGDDLRTLHPLLVAGAVITGAHTIDYTHAGTTYVVDYGNAQIDYSFQTAGASQAEAVLALSRYHAFINSLSALLLSRGSTAPEVLRQYGIPGVARGTLFAVG